jgi:hypothetical protein
MQIRNVIAMGAVLGALALSGCASVDEPERKATVILEGVDLDDDWELEFDD